MVPRSVWIGAKIPGTTELFDRGIGGHGAQDVKGLPVGPRLIDNHVGQPGGHGNDHFNIQGDFRIGGVGVGGAGPR